MKLDRNGLSQRGKYGLILNRNVDALRGDGGHLPEDVRQALYLLEQREILQWSYVGGEEEAFVIKLKDRYAAMALHSYANEAYQDDPEYAGDVRDLARRSGPASPWCKKPD